MIRRTRWVCASLLWVKFGIVPAAEIVSYKNLDRLPAGTAITLQGSTKDVCVEPAPAMTALSQKCTGRTLADVAKVTALKLTYKVAGLEAREVAGTASDDQWSVSMDPLPENGSVTLTLEFAGALPDRVVEEAMDKWLGSEEFKAALDKLIQQARENQKSGTPGEITAKNATAVEEFFAKLVPVLLAKVPSFLHPMVGDDAPEHLVKLIPSVSALPNALRDVQGLPEVQALLKESPPANQSYFAVAQALKSSKDLRAVNYQAQWKATRDALKGLISAKITTSLAVTASSGVKDFEKYAAVDLGVAWIPGIEELRSFVTVNIYLGPVEERPYTKGIWKETLRQTISLTAGYAFADISGRNPQQGLFRDNNAFLVGVGVRLNKYFRLIGGTAIYRRELLTAPAAGTVSAELQGRLRTAAFLGGSIDVTALPNLRALFGKAGATTAPPVSAPKPAPPKETPAPKPQ